MMRFFIAAAMVAVLFHTGSASAEESLRVLLDWKAGAERGGFYQAQALGIYKKHGLAVTIVQGGPGGEQPADDRGRRCRCRARLERFRRS